MDKDTALKLALDCLEDIFGKEKIDVGAINALRQAIAEAEKQEPVACPFPCGWKRLFEIIVADGAFLARSLEEGEAITEHQREVVMQMIGYAKDMALHGMKAIREALAQSNQESDDLTIAYMSGFHDGKNKYAPQPEQEPVAWRSWNDKDKFGFWDTKAEAESWCDLDFDSEPLYTSPPQPKPLTDEQLIAAYESEQQGRYGDHIRSLRAIEAKLREKNT